MNLNKLKELLILHEAKRNRMYKCSAGYNTIGVGHNLDANPISDRAVDIILDDDINIVLNDLNRAFPWWRDMDEVRQVVLADMCFNMGLSTLSFFKNTLKAMEEGRWEDAAKGMENSKWYGQVGNRSKRLVKMMRTGEYDE